MVRDLDQGSASSIAVPLVATLQRCAHSCDDLGHPQFDHRGWQVTQQLHHAERHGSAQLLVPSLLALAIGWLPLITMASTCGHHLQHELLDGGQDTA